MRLLITEFSYSLDFKWLRRAFDIVVSMSRGKSELPRLDLLTKLCLSLARAQMPIPASVILRLILRKKNLPPVDMLGLIFLHMVKTDTGTILASNILSEMCCLYQHIIDSKSNYAKIVKPDTLLFNLILDACARMKSSVKGQQMVELMAQVGVVADAHSIVIISQIYEMNKMRDELKRFERHIDRVSAPLVFHYRQFYDSLLSLHFLFNDIDAASALITEMCRFKDCNPSREGDSEPCSVPIGSASLKMGLKLQFLPELQLNDTVMKVEGKPKYVLHENGKLALSSKALAKLVREYRSRGRINELSRLLICIQNKLWGSESVKLSRDVINACIHLGWLETAHDILDDLEGSPIDISLYMSLLDAYYSRKMFKVGDRLVKQIKSNGLGESLSHEMAISGQNSELESRRTSRSENVGLTSKSDLVESIIQEMKEVENIYHASAVIHQLNSSIYYFTKAKMIGDALKTYRRMLEIKVQPTVQTYAYLIDGYSAMGMYREITVLWGDIKRNLERSNSMVYRDLYESLLLNFIRGGYFERVLEIIAFMTENRMYLDKWIYRNEFFKFHKGLYKNKKASDTGNEVQMQRLEHVQTFRKWLRAS
ncbi:OLC1v1031554C1 [Oldenlandia corymbosa var. corymbosa]|nr:OLC1v1031554C1 [Oldenlandia corymbosa var. corymbosa]